MRMWRMVVGLVLYAMVLGCGEDGNSVTPAGTPVSLAMIKGYLTGTGIAGSQVAANLSGFDNHGAVWRGALNFTATGPKVVSGQNVTESQTTLVFTPPSGASSQAVNTLDFLPNGDLFQQTTTVTGQATVTGTPTVQGQLPNLALVGQSGNLWTISESDGTILTVTWRLDPDFGGCSRLVITSVTTLAGTTVDQESNSIFLNPNGNPFRFIVADSTGGNSIVLAGDRL